VIAKKKPGDILCGMFGCVNEETSKQSRSCRQCAEINPELYKECMKQNALMRIKINRWRLT